MPNLSNGAGRSRTLRVGVILPSSPHYTVPLPLRLGDRESVFCMCFLSVTLSFINVKQNLHSVIKLDFQK